MRFSWGTKRKRDWEWSSWLPNWHSWVIWFNDLLSLPDFFYFARRLESFGCARKAKGAVRGICAKDLFFFVAESSFFLFLSLFLLSSVSQVPQPTWLVNCLMASPPGCSLKSLKSPPIDDGDDAAEVKEEQNEEKWGGSENVWSEDQSWSISRQYQCLKSLCLCLV